MFSSAEQGSASGISRLFDGIIRNTLYALAVLMPIFFLPWTSEVLEFNKQTLLLAGAGIAGLAWLGKALVTKRLEYRHTFINVVVALFVAATGLAAAFSQNRYISIMGDAGQQKGSFVTVLAFGILYFVIVNTVRNAAQIRKLLVAMVTGGFVAALFAFLQGMGWFILPFGFAKSASFNTVGTAAALGMYLAFLTTVSGGLLLAPHGSQGPAKWGKATSIYLIAVSLFSVLLMAIIEFFPVLVTLMVGSVILIGFAIGHARAVRGITGIFLPVLAFVVGGLVLLFKFPIDLKYPAEVMPSLSASAKIAYSTLQQHPLLGSGPGTFISDYSRFHSAEVNVSQFWAVRFDRSASRFLTIVATMGMIGALSYILVVLIAGAAAGRRLADSDEETWHIMVGIFAAWAAIVAARFIYSSTITLEFAFWMALALMAASLARDEKVVHFEDSPRAGMSASFALIVGAVVALSGLFVIAQRYTAEAAYAGAVRADQSGSVSDVISKLTAAAQHNQYSDSYLRNFAVAKLAEANQTLNTPSAKKDPKETDQQFKDRTTTDTQQRSRTAGQQAADAVALAKRATEIVPSNVANWAILGYVYQSLMAVTPNAGDFAIAAYQKAHELEPVNPSFLTELGKITLAQGDAARQNAQSKDEAVKKAAQQKADDLTAQALDYFNQAVALKTDYAPAHYQIALTFDRQGKLKESIGKMESVVRYSPTDIGVGFQLALLYYRDGRKDAAITLLNSVIKLSPNFSNARWYLAAMLEEKGDFDGAIAQLTETQKLNPENEAIAKRIAEVQAKKVAPAPAQPGELPPPVDEAPDANVKQ